MHPHMNCVWQHKEMENRMETWVFTMKYALLKFLESNPSEQLPEKEGQVGKVPSGYVKIAIEHGHRNSGFAH